MNQKTKYHILERMLGTPKSYCMQPSLKKRAAEIKYKFNHKFETCLKA